MKPTKTYTLERTNTKTGLVVEVLTGLTADQVLEQRGLDTARIIREPEGHDGKWVISGCEETWDFAETYASREEAIENVPGYCEEYGRNTAFVGQARRLTYDGLLTTSDIERLEESMDEQSFEEGGCEDPIMQMNPIQQECLRLFIAGWMEKHLDPINWYVVERVEHVPS